MLNAAVDRDRKKLLQKANEAAKKMGDTAAAADLPDIEEHSALGHLVEQAAIKGNASLSRKGHDFLSRVALAVSEDCPKCQQERERGKAQA